MRRKQTESNSPTETRGWRRPASLRSVGGRNTPERVA